MILLSKHLQEGNWVLYKPENQFLIVVRKKGDSITLKDYTGFPEIRLIAELDAVKINSHNLSGSGFREKVENTMIHTVIEDLNLIRVSSETWIVQYKSKQIQVSYVHELQNACFELTTIQIEVNLFGII